MCNQDLLLTDVHLLHVANEIIVLILGSKSKEIMHYIKFIPAMSNPN